FTIQGLPGLDIFGGTEIVDSGTGTRDQVGNAEPPLRQPDIIFISDPYRRQSRIAEQFPESIGIAGKVVSGHRGAHTRINTDKKNTQTLPDTILKTQVRPVAGSQLHFACLTTEASYSSR